MGVEGQLSPPHDSPASPSLATRPLPLNLPTKPFPQHMLFLLSGTDLLLLLGELPPTLKALLKLYCFCTVPPPLLFCGSQGWRFTLTESACLCVRPSYHF